MRNCSRILPDQSVTPAPPVSGQRAWMPHSCCSYDMAGDIHALWAGAGRHAHDAETACAEFHEAETTFAHISTAGPWPFSLGGRSVAGVPGGGDSLVLAQSTDQIDSAGRGVEAAGRGVAGRV